MPAKARAIETRWRMPPDSACGKSLAWPAEPKPVEPRRGDLAALRRRHLVELKPQRHVVDRGAPRHQPVVLKNDADLAAEPVEIGIGIVALHRDTAVRRLDQAGDQIERRRLAAAGLAENGDQLAAPDRKAQIANRFECRVRRRGAETTCSPVRTRFPAAALTRHARRRRGSAARAFRSA